MPWNPSSFKAYLKRIYLSIGQPNRLIALDYPAVPKPSYTLQNPHRKLLDIISGNQEQYAELLHASKEYFPALQAIRHSKKETDIQVPTWNSGYMPGLDMMMLYTILNHFKPKKYIEIGSGTSTKIAGKARKEAGLNYTITCIDPLPRQEINAIADEWHQKRVQEVSVDLFSGLSANDFVFFDGTHMLLPSSDVGHFFLELLPCLPKGVLVQVHDIYLPYDYPQAMCDRYYSENYILGAVLLAHPEKYKIICPNFYISREPQLAEIIESFWRHPNLQSVEKHGGSFWFQVQ
jgi:predicted O-methyltransferase YrrM